MERIESINLVEIYEIDGEDKTGLDMPKLTIKEHWNSREFVVLWMDGNKITVLADQLKRAISNAQNAHKY